MKKLLIVVFAVGLLIHSYGQTTLITPGNLGNNIQTSSSKGGIQFPNMPFDSIKAISNPKQGTIVYDTDCQCLRMFNGNSWTSYLASNNHSEATGNFKVWQDAIIPSSTPAQASAFFQTTGMVSDSAGNIYACGQTLGSFIYNLVQYNNPFNAIAEIGFLVKYDKSGKLIWLKRMSSDGGFVRPKQIAFDPGGNLYVGGDYITSAQFQGTSGNINISTPMPIQFGAFTAKFNLSGDALWVRGEYGAGTLGSNISCNSLVVGTSGDVYTLGYIRGTLESPPNGSGTITSGDNSTTDCFLIKYDGSGNRIWAKDFGSNNLNEVGNGIAFLNEKLYITGRFRSNTSLGGIALTNNTNSENGFLARINATNGNSEWAVTISGLGAGDDAGSDVVISKNASLYVTGTCTSSAANPVIFGSTNNSNSVSFFTLNHSTDYFLAKYNEAGIAVSTQKIGSFDTEDGLPKLVTDAVGNVYFAGTPQVPVQMGGIVGQGYSGREALFAKYDANLRLQWYFMANGYGNDEARALTVTPEGWLFGTGVFNDITRLSNTTLNSAQGMIYFVRYRE